MKLLLAAGLFATASVFAAAAPAFAGKPCDATCEETGAGVDAPVATDPGPETNGKETTSTTPSVDPAKSEESTGVAPSDK